ncbi:MAG: thiazole biosynthesis adenylyltransferase ThiF [Planctomycetota bacterium]|nr:MAG: thiazole biosynthesis adenylyltransferase ThiF [Planctomycetota bacterium]HMC63901.1 ThiF family adenylyltransferase [Gemmataceae bacterium]
MEQSLERYSRQMRFYGIGEDGQRRLLESHVTLCGCGALGTVLANALVRAGVGHLRLVDRDFIETNNLQRQVLFDEHDVAENLPKAEAAARKLGAINSTVHVEPVVTDIDRTNILGLVKDADLILDGTDNFEIRYLINDAAVQLGKPWVYGGCIGSHGQTMTILPDETPCLRCVFEAAPAPGEAGTCETAGVLSPIVNIVASYQATEALKILTGRRDQINRDLIYVDVWENIQRRIKIAPLLGKVDCPCCRRRRFEWLDGEHGAQTTSLCGRNAVQVAHRSATRLNFEELARHLEAVGDVSYNRFLLKFNADGHEFTVFPDGRAIIKGTSDVDKARTLYAKYIGH